MSLQLEPETKPIGKPEDVPHASGPECHRMLPETILKHLDYEKLNGVIPQPGRCRFCRRTLPVAKVQVADMLFPVLQCDRVATLWPQVDAIREQRKAAAQRERMEAIAAAKAGRKNKPEEWC
jgi:hypothetical protein